MKRFRFKIITQDGFYMCAAENGEKMFGGLIFGSRDECIQNIKKMFKHPSWKLKINKKTYSILIDEYANEHSFDNFKKIQKKGKNGKRKRTRITT